MSDKGFKSMRAVVRHTLCVVFSTYGARQSAINKL